MRFVIKPSGGPLTDCKLSCTKQKVPLPFTSYMKGMLPDKASLRDSRGNLWPVEVIKMENDFFLADGWVSFVAENGVRRGDFLVFWE